MATVAIVGMVLQGCSDDKPVPVTPDEPSVPEDPIDYFRKDSVNIVNRPTGDMWYSNFLRIVDSEGNSLLDKKNPNNVRDNNFYLEYGDSIFHMADGPRRPGVISYKTIEEDGTGWYEVYMSLDPYASEINCYGDDVITIGNGGTRYGRLDKTFTFVWPERNIRKEFRVLWKIWTEGDYLYWQNGTIFDGEPTGFLMTLVVD